MDFDYVREHYNVPACYGRRVVVDGKPGIIVADKGHHIGVNFDADKPGDIRRCHPTWEVVYSEMGQVRPMTKAQRRYQHYLDVSDCFDNFHHYLRYSQTEDYRKHHPDLAW